MSYQTPKKSSIPAHVKAGQENVPPVPASSVQGSTPGQVAGPLSNWTFLTPRKAESAIPRLPWSFRRGETDGPDFETPTRIPKHDMAHERLMQILEESDQKAVTIPDLPKGQQWPVQSASIQEPIRNFVLPIRQPMQPDSAPSFSGGTFEPAPDKVASDKYYWPMNSIHGILGSPFAALSLAEQPAAVHLGHSDSKYSKPMLVSDETCNAPCAATKNSARADESDAPSKVALGFSPEYHGDPNLPRNKSANIPDELNCSLFLVNLPPTLSTHRLIAAIHAMGPTGRIYATHINAPEPDRKHYGCAAKVIFFELAAAKAFYRACEERGFTVDGFNVRVMWNRIKTGQQDHARSTTRVLLVGGKPDFVNPTTLTEYFCTKLQFQIDCIITHSDGLKGDADAVVEYRFGSFRCQAEAAKMALVREHPEVRCFFHCDPCDPGHWKPSQPVPVGPAARPTFPVAPPNVPRKDPGFRPGLWRFQGLPAVREGAGEQHAFRPMRSPFVPFQA